MGKARDKWYGFDKLTRRIITIGAVMSLLTATVSGCWAAVNHYSTNTRVTGVEYAVNMRIDEVGNLVAEVKLERRIEWLERQEVTFEEEEKAGNQSQRRKANCKKWSSELERKYGELKKLQT